MLFPVADREDTSGCFGNSKSATAFFKSQKGRFTCISIPQYLSLKAAVSTATSSNPAPHNLKLEATETKPL